jgi:hypothetical protein
MRVKDISSAIMSMLDTYSRRIKVCLSTACKLKHNLSSNMLFQQSPAPPSSNTRGPCAYTQLQRTPLSHIRLIFEAVLTQCYVNATTFRLISHSGLARHRLASFIAVFSIVALDLLNTVATLAKSRILFLW